MYLLDTDVLVQMLRQPASSLLLKLASVAREDLFTTSISVGELVYGAYRVPLRTSVVLWQVDSIVLPNWPVLPFGLEAARHYGEIRATLERQGMRLADADLRIAAIALAQGLTLVTGNVRHFERVPGLPVENWLEDQTL